MHYVHFNSTDKKKKPKTKETVKPGTDFLFTNPK